MKKYHKDGIDVYEESWEQLTKDKAFEGYLPEEVCISLCIKEKQMCLPTVQIGETVSKGQIIGKLDDIEAGCIHASISGKIEDIFYIQRAPGILEPFVKIKKTTPTSGRAKINIIHISLKLEFCLALRIYISINTPKTPKIELSTNICFPKNANPPRSNKI